MEDKRELEEYWRAYENMKKAESAGDRKARLEQSRQERIAAIENVKPATGYDIFGHTVMYKSYRIMDVPADVLIKMYKNGAFKHDIPIKKHVEAAMVFLENEVETGKKRDIFKIWSGQKMDQRAA